jgi:hypothetical protein
MGITTRKIVASPSLRPRTFIDQFWFGHRAQKRTKLYICGCKPKNVPKIPIRLGKATHTVGLWSGRNRQTCRPSILKKEYEATPEEFAEWLIS